MVMVLKKILKAHYKFTGNFAESDREIIEEVYILCELITLRERELIVIQD